MSIEVQIRSSGNSRVVVTGQPTREQIERFIPFGFRVHWNLVTVRFDNGERTWPLTRIEGQKHGNA